MAQSQTLRWPRNPATPGRLSLKAVGPRLAQRNKPHIDHVIDNLSKLGHKIKLWDQISYLAGGLCAIQINNELKTLTAGADPRRDAYAIGR